MPQNLSAIIEQFVSVRKLSEAICAPLESEDYTIQSMDDVSPPKWHLAHSTWFFEEFILKPFVGDYKIFDENFCYLFNSYYNAVGVRHPRPDRGLLARPAMTIVRDYRHHVDKCLTAFLSKTNPDSEVLRRLEIGINHEQQHQELLLTDIKYNFFKNPLLPAYDTNMEDFSIAQNPMEWRSFEEGVIEIGADKTSFCYDNELPRHRRFVEPFAIATRPVTNGEYREFIEAGGYEDSRYWLSDGWDWVSGEGSKAPLYWKEKGGNWYEFTLQGLVALDPNALVNHISYYEADAYAQFRGCRLPYEAEWEMVAATQTPSDHFILSHRNSEEIDQGESVGAMYGCGWQWTIDAYLPYPGFSAESGALGEYNGKFMCNQKVLRGGSIYTPPGHIRPSYRNFFPLHARWQKTMIRLAKSLDKSKS